MFETLTASLKGATDRIRFSDSEKSLQKSLSLLKRSLLKSSVYYKVVKELVKNIEEDTKKSSLLGKNSFVKAIRKNLADILTIPNSPQGFVFLPKPPTVILVCGLQGSGKTTTVAKMAYFLKNRKKKTLVTSCDFQRLAALEQLKQLCSENSIDVFIDDSKNNNPIHASKNALVKAKELLYDVLIIDTAGRLSMDEELIKELQDIKRVIKPYDTFYIADSMSGQDAVRSASQFNNKIGISGVVLTKYDSDSKGGIAISIADQIGIPLRFIANGEKITDIESFIPDRIVNRLMGGGDIATLVETTSTVLDSKKAKQIQRKIKKGAFNFNDFYDQLESMKKIGNLSSLLSMIPGASSLSKNMKNIDFEASKEIKKIKAMILSMTLKERENPSLLNNSRKRRIATGSGLSQVEVNRFLKQFKNLSKTAKKMSNKKHGDKILDGLASKQNNIY